jgi:hypothetical protein
MNERPQKDSNQHGEFNLWHEYLRGAMYRGGTERDDVITGYALGIVAQIVFVAGLVLLGTLLMAFGVDLGEVIAEMAVDLPLLLLALIAITFIGCVIFVYTLAQRMGIK